MREKVRIRWGRILFISDRARSLKKKKKRITEYFFIDIILDLVTAFHVFGI